MSLWVGIDDTDSPRGGCTTFVLTELLALARDHDLDVIGEPRLVRLNPNIPWKTRGNAALGARFGHGAGRGRTVGEIADRPVRAFSRGRPPTPEERAEFLDAAWKLVRSTARDGDEHTDPAIVATDRPLPPRLYWDAVRNVVPFAQVRVELDRHQVWYRTEGTERGLVGASAAIAWPGRRATWEMIAYRRTDRAGLPREVDALSVRRAQARHPDLFLCFDPRTRRLLVAPHTPCPILFGLRGTTAAAPLAARREIVSEPVERWALFRTNQGTGDHLLPRSPAAWGQWVSGSVRGHVAEEPVPLAGGHVRFPIETAAGESAECVAFEPTKTLPRLAGRLRRGDQVRVWGSRGVRPEIRLEGIELIRRAQNLRRLGPPRCSTCGRGARSQGHMRGYRCRTCGRRWPPEAGQPLPRPSPPALGRYHPTPSARRHLAPRGPEP